ncbi:FxsA family protein [Cohnella yongneupensis]|uniref:FxsA family protein n=1 Tax=Cohnella yongneupensis TaxID=425006 RepID=A0ABW0R1Z2_9BACL
MRRWLLALIIIFPGVELWGIIEMGKKIGGWSTLGLLVLSGLLGAWLAQLEGRKVLLQAQRQMQSGQIPGMSLLDGICVLIGGVLLIIPGFVSDAIGLTMILPFTRPLYRLFLYRWLERKLRKGTFTIHQGPWGRD